MAVGGRLVDPTLLNVGVPAAGGPATVGFRTADLFGFGAVGAAAPAAKWAGRFEYPRMLVARRGFADLREDEAIAIAATLGMEPAELLALLAASEERADQ